MAAKWTVAPSHEELAFLVEAGIIYRDAKNFQGARDVFTGVKELFPQYDFPEVFLGTVDFQEGHFEAAEAHYRKALEVNPRSACITASVSSSASLSCGTIPTTGRLGTICGNALSRSSVLTYSAVARESKSVFTHRPWTPSSHDRRDPLDSVI